MRAVPDISKLGRMAEQRSVRFTVAGVALMQHVASLLEPLNLTPSRALALGYIDAHPGCDQTSLGKAMVLVDNLEAAGFVRRDPGPDRRTHALHLTAEGQATMENALRVNEEILSTLLGGVQAPDWPIVARVIDDMLARAAASD